ncbi:DUF3846 domain-containing protein [Micromonospora tarensis]|uniref:DUF3846 domain-containing protein n=1 Tax=Micromonospora tarensis TaxID=2806100 RepID=A0ABS1YCK1_9ACTN|nr:DUF3846 domain-containing protein [Micromonospora tarensis]MBM0275133.1 DUF3846 domain-containing protein [Micromonospora tarensis]
MSGYLRVDVDGTLTAFEAEPTSALIREAIGDWWDMVHLPNALMGWVDGDGHPKGLPRNVVGSILLMALGAAQMPYAGPVVISGWHTSREIVGLAVDREQVVRAVHARVAAAMAGAVDDDGFADAVRETAAELGAAPTPAMRVVPLGGDGR